jgi:thiamine biosynthesis lipoprotein
MRIAILTAMLCVSCYGCDPASLAQHQYSGATMGTTFNVKVVVATDQEPAEDLSQQLQQVLDDIEEQTSTYMQESELSRFNENKSTDWTRVSQQLCRRVEQALSISRKTNGAFDITVGPLVNLWGFGPTGGRDKPPDETEIEALLARVGFDKLQSDCELPALRKAHPRLYVDLSGWAKGFAADELAEVLTGNGIENFLVEVGGELRAQGLNASGEAWRIAIEKPSANGRDIQTVLNISNTGLATSGDYRNFFEYEGSRYSHTIDPRSGRPVTHQLASVTVMHESAATADGLATALLVLGPDDGIALATELGVKAIFVVRGPQGLESFTIPSTN